MLAMIKNQDGTISWANVALAVGALFVTVGAGTGLGYYLRGASAGDEASCRSLLDPLRENYNDCVTRRDRALGDLQRALQAGAGAAEISSLRDQVSTLQKSLQEAGANYSTRLRQTVERVVGLKDRQQAIGAEIGPMENRRQGLFRTMMLVLQEFSNIATQLPLYMNWTRFRVEMDGRKTDFSQTAMTPAAAQVLDGMVRNAWRLNESPNQYLFDAPSGARWADLGLRFTSEATDFAIFDSFSAQVDQYSRTFGLTLLSNDQKIALFGLWHKAQMVFSLKAAIDDIDSKVIDNRNQVNSINTQLDSMLRA